MIYAIHVESKQHRIVTEGSDAAVLRNCPMARGEYFVFADPDGWIPWDGGECPLPENRNFSAKIRGGEIHCACNAWRWDRQGLFSDIIAYRPILDAKEPSRCDNCDGVGVTAFGDDCHRCRKPEPPAWDGESWPPPIGSVIESSATWKDGTPAEVLAVRHGKVIGCHVETGVAGWLEREFCRPIRSEEDRAVDAMLSVVECSEGHYTLCGPMADAMRELYRAGLRFPKEAT